MQPGELKPILTALAFPPAGPLLLALLGLLWARRRRGAGLALAGLSIVGLLLLSTNAVAVLLSRAILPQVPPLPPEQLSGVQAVVVLGGGVLPTAPEYGAAQLAPQAFGRLRYGALLARQAGKPLAFAGGVGWSAMAGQEPEGQVARRVLQQEYGLPLRWLDDQSRDTHENAQRLAALMLPAGARHIVLVTDATHMPRALHYFREAGFEAVAAPTHYPTRRDRAIVEWLPSTQGLMTSTQVLREWLGMRVARL